MAYNNTLAVIQGRMGSSRLPGKILLDLAGKPMLMRVVERTRQAQIPDLVAVATTSDPSDDPVAAFCQEHSIPFFRGHMFDVLDRFYQAALHFHAETIIRITADCPLIDPILIDQTTTLVTENAAGTIAGVDFACDRLPPPWKRTFPIGLDVEVCTFAALERAWREADQKHQREHVMPYLYEDIKFSSEIHPLEDGHSYIKYGSTRRGFSDAQLHHDPDHGSLRWTVDTPEDLELMRRIFPLLDGDNFSWQDVLALQQHQPDLFSVNAGVEHKGAFDVDERHG